MPYSYDRRASQEDEPWQERQNDTGDAHRSSSDLLEQLKKDPDSELSACIDRAAEIEAALDSAEICDQERDFDHNVQEAHTFARELQEQIKKSLQKARR